MREPTRLTDAYRWWSEALQGLAPPPVNEVPQAGFYKRKLVKGGPWVPVAIWIDSQTDESGELTQPEVIRCTVDGKLSDPISEWGYVCSQPITRKEYERLKQKTIAEIDADEHAPRRPIDLLTVAPPKFKTGD